MPLDIALGMLLSLGVSEYLGIEATYFFITFGIASALLPDIDIVTKPLLGKWYHRTHTHFPLTYIPLALLAFVFLPLQYALLFTLAVLAHFIHDTIGIGFGIAWLWPFSDKKLLFPDGERRGALGWIAVWSPQEEERVRGVVTSNSWVKHYYFRPNPIAYVEYGALLVAVILLVLYFV